MTQIIASPLKVPISKNKGFILNLNAYRNTHFQSLNKAKVVYKDLMTPDISALTPYDAPVKFVYILYPKTRRLTDIGNVCSVHQKFFEDAFVRLGKLPEDTYEWIPQVIYKFGHVDKHNPRVDIIIDPMTTVPAAITPVTAIHPGITL